MFLTHVQPVYSEVMTQEPLRAPILGEPLAIELANTRFVLRGRPRDGLASAADLAAWLTAMEARLPAHPNGSPPEVTAADLTAARRVRDAVRALLDAWTSRAELHEGACRVLEAAASTAPRWLAVESGPPPTLAVRTSARPVTAVIALLAEDALRLVVQDTAHAVRACVRPECSLFFVKDHPRRTRCSPACSDRARAARRYAKRA